MFLLSAATHRMVLQYHPRIGHLYVPGVTARIPGEQGAYYLRTNAQGFRSDVDFVPAKGEKPRILVFGDSYTAGDGVANGARYPEQLGEMFGAEVFNYGLAGTGTDQHLLILEELAKGVQADLIVLGLAVHNIDRIKVAFREYIERSTGRHVLGPKPFFTLENGGLLLHNVPVPLERPEADTKPADASVEQTQTHDNMGLFSRLKRMRDELGLKKVEEVVEHQLPDLKPWFRSQVLKLKDFQPHEDYRGRETPGWQLMEAILRRFIAAAAPTPVLIVPIPTYYYYMDQLDPKYQPLFESLAAPERGVHVMNLTAPLSDLPRGERSRIPLGMDTHFSAWGHNKIAELIAQEIDRRNMLPGRNMLSAAASAAAGVAAEARPVAAPPTSGQPASGLPASTASTAAGGAGRPNYILGISCFYHNSGASLIRDGEIVAACEEERFTRVKNDPRFPHAAINFCLEQAGIQPKDLAAVVYYDNAALTFERILHTLLAVGPKSEEGFGRIMPFWVRQKLHIPQLIRKYLDYDGLILQDIHHRGHAASAFYPSTFERAAILTIDGVGEWATASIGAGNGSSVRLLEEMHFPNSLGLLYSAFTQFTGFKVNSGEYKMMGLAPYGTPKYGKEILEHLVDLKEDGSLELNQDYFSYLADPTMTGDKFAELFGGPPRELESHITQREMDLARSVQWVTEEAMLKMARHAQKLTGERKLCLAGGVALNCVANGRLLREGPFDDIWIQPAAGDSGASLGVALDAYHTYFGQPRKLRADGRPAQRGSWWGPGYSEAEIRGFLDTYGCQYTLLSEAERADRVADLLAAGKVVGHFTGRTEFGPRALGARSILGDPRNPDMQARLNLKIKFRESFRPFAPAVPADRAAEYFEIDRESPYMLLVAPVRQERRKHPEKIEGEDMLAIVKQLRSDIPAVTHIDYSARIQTITAVDNPQYYEVARAFEKKTGCAVIVNTSFNVRGEPIVNTPWEAYRCFMRTQMDALILGNFLLLKEDQPDARAVIDEVAGGQAAPAPPDPALDEALQQLYRTAFAPAQARLAAGGGTAVRVRTRGTRAPSLWEAVSEPEPQRIFAVDRALDESVIRPAAMAEAIVRQWTRGPATDALKPVVQGLLEIALKHPAADTEGSGTVSESMYVMY